MGEGDTIEMATQEHAYVVEGGYAEPLEQHGTLLTAGPAGNDWAVFLAATPEGALAVSAAYDRACREDPTIAQAWDHWRGLHGLGYSARVDLADMEPGIDVPVWRLDEDGQLVREYEPPAPIMTPWQDVDVCVIRGGVADDADAGERMAALDEYRRQGTMGGAYPCSVGEYEDWDGEDPEPGPASVHVDWAGFEEALAAARSVVYVILARHHGWAPEPGQGEGWEMREGAEGAVSLLAATDGEGDESAYRIEERARGWGRT